MPERGPTYKIKRIPGQDWTNAWYAMVLGWGWRTYASYGYVTDPNGVQWTARRIDIPDETEFFLCQFIRRLR